MFKKKRRAVICIHCGMEMTYESTKIEADIHELMKEHIKKCPENPLVQALRECCITMTEIQGFLLESIKPWDVGHQGVFNTIDESIENLRKLGFDIYELTGVNK